MKLYLIVRYVFVLLLFVLVAPVAQAATAPSLNTAGIFAVLAGSGITNSVGPTTITGDAGSSPTPTEVGFGSVAISGTNHNAADPNDLTTQGAKNDLTAAYNTTAGLVCDTDLSGQDLGSLTLTPGVYCFTSAAGLTGTLTLNGQGNPNAVFIFKIVSSLTTATSSQVSLINSAQACNVFWQVGSSATLGSNSVFKGNILAFSSITDTGGSNVTGRFLARNALVTLSNTTLTSATCAPSLHLRKTVTNDNGGSAINTAWTITATGTVGSPTNLSGTTPVDSDASFKADTYTLGESGGPAGYTASTYSCVKNSGAPVVSNSITLVAGDSAICTINNNDNPAHLIVIKHVINDSGGVATASSFSTTITGVTTVTPTASGAESPGVDNILTTIGAYSVDEGAHVGYDKTLSVGCSGTIALGEAKTCTVANDDIPPGSGILHVIKHVINNDGGVALASAWTLAVISSNLGTGIGSAVGVESPGTTYTLQAGKAYSVIESGGPSGYTASSSTDCTIANVVANTSYTCTITNDDVLAIATINVVKTVINDNGQTKTVSDFPLFVNGTLVVSGVTNTFPAGSYTISETSDPHYKQTFSVDCQLFLLTFVALFKVGDEVVHNILASTKWCCKTKLDPFGAHFSC